MADIQHTQDIETRQCRSCGEHRPFNWFFTSIGRHKSTGRVCSLCRFWRHVDKSETCWTWNASCNTKGYGMFKCTDRKIRLAHRVAWELVNGAINDGLFVLHHCDNPSCVRLDHLFLGTNQDNMIDMMQKRRQTYKLTREQVENIRSRCVVVQGRIRHRFIGTSVRSLSSEFGVSRPTIERILRRDIWAWSDSHAET